MVNTKFTKDELMQFCAEVHADDGQVRRTTSHKQSVDYHQEQLAKQIHIALEEVFLSEIQDPLLEGVQIKEVRPIEGSSNMLVSLITEEDEAEGRLKTVRTYIRTLIASKINRKKVPDLKFVVINHK